MSWWRFWSRPKLSEAAEHLLYLLARPGWEISSGAKNVMSRDGLFVTVIDIRDSLVDHYSGVIVEGYGNVFTDAEHRVLFRKSKAVLDGLLAKKEREAEVVRKTDTDAARRRLTERLRLMAAETSREGLL